MKRMPQKIQGQTSDKPMAKPGGVVKKILITCNKAVRTVWSYTGCSKSVVPPPWPKSSARVLTGKTEFATNRADGKGLCIEKRHKVRILC